MHKVLLLVTFFVLSNCSSAAHKNDPDTASAAAKSKLTQTKGGASDMKMSQGELVASSQCSKASDKRLIETFRTKSGGCEVRYTKFKKTKVMGSALTDFNYCEDLMSRIKGNLATAGYGCS